MVRVIIDGYVEHIQNHTYIIYSDSDYYVVQSNKNYKLNDRVEITGTLKSRLIGNVVTYEIIET